VPENPTQATEAEIRDFFDELTEFRETLSPLHQELLEELTAAAFSRPAPEVEGYAAVEYTPPSIAFMLVTMGLVDTPAVTNSHGWLTSRCAK